MATFTTACPLDCPDTCSLAVTVEDGRLTAVDAAPGNPLTAGYICHKVKHHARRVYSPERIMTPLLRAGPKGEARFRQASWDEAIELVAARFGAAVHDHGPASVLPYLYSSSAAVLAVAGAHPAAVRTAGGARGRPHHLRGDAGQAGTTPSATCSRPIRWTSRSAASSSSGAPTRPSRTPTSCRS